MSARRILSAFIALLVVISFVQTTQAACNTNDLYDAYIGLTFDDILPFERMYPTTPLPSARNTYSKRAQAHNFFMQQYGINVYNPNNNIDFSPKAFEGYVVQALLVPSYPRSAGINTDLGVHEDIFSAITTAPVTLYGNFGGSQGVDVPKGTILPFGFYSFYFKANGTTPAAIPEINYRGTTPVLPFDHYAWVMDYELTSSAWGNGIVMGGFTPMPDTKMNGMWDISMRAIMTFPGYLATTPNTGKITTCQNWS